MLLNIINDKPPRQNSTIMNTSLLLLDLIHKWNGTDAASEYLYSYMAAYFKTKKMIIKNN